MRILLISLHHVEYAIELAIALSEKRHRIQLVLAKEKVNQTVGDRLTQLVSSVVSCTILPYRAFVHPTIFSNIFMMLKLYICFRPHVVHVQECANPLNLLFFLFRYRPLFTTVHDVDLHPGTDQSRLTHKRFWTKRILRKYFYGSIIVHGEKLKRLFRKRYAKAEADVHAVPHGCLFSFLPARRSENREEPHTVLFFGRMEKYKGLRCLIETEPLVSEKIDDFKIVLAGQGEEMDIHKSRLCINPHFEVHDRYIPFDEVSFFFQRASAVVLPYIEASQSGVAAMAFAFGKPVIATNVGSLSEVVFNGKNGILVPVGDSQKLSEAIVSLLQNHQEKERLREGALKTANTLLSWTNVAELTINAYRSKVSK